MLHRIDADSLGAQGAHMARAVSTCVHCGFCLPACPTYRVLGEEMDSPRGRILLMKTALEGALPLDEALPHVDRCLGCVACVSACPSGVQYGELLTPFRAYAESRRRRPPLERLRRRLVLETLPYPARFRAAVRLGHVARRAAKLVPGPLRAMLDLIPSSLPAAPALPAEAAALGARRARVALLVGCAQEVLAPNITRAAIRVLTRCGVEVVVPPGQGCCGALAMHVGADGLARELAAANLQAFPSDVDAIVSTAAGCGSGMKEYELLFAGTPDEARAHAFAARVMDVSAFLEQLGPPEVPPLPGPVRVAYHDACHLQHAQRVAEAPRALLGRVPNLALVEIPDDYCCGSAGTYNMDQPDIARELGARKARAILETDARIVASGNIGCTTQIATHLQALAGAEAPEVMHTVEVLDRAFAGGTPVRRA